VNQTPQQKSKVNQTLIQYREVNAIFDTSPIKGITTKENVINIKEAFSGKYLTVCTNLPLTPSRLISFSDANALVVHFPHNDALIVTVLIGNCRVSKILINEESSVNIHPR